MKLNKILAVCAVALFLLSFFSYRDSVTRAERFERGQKFLPNLNPDEIASISIREGKMVTELERQGEDSFLVTSANGYLADTESINRFLKEVLEAGLEKEIGANAGLRDELELVAGGENTKEVVFTNAADKEMVRFLVGKSFADGGSYVRRADGIDGEEGTVFLTSRTLQLSTKSEDFVEKEILDVEQDQIARLAGADFLIDKADGSDLMLTDIPSGRKETAKVSQLETVLSGLRFTRHLLANDPEVLGLEFDAQLEIDLDDQSGYRVMVASRNEKHYLRIEGYHSSEQLSIAMDASEDEVRETSEVLARGDEIQQFNGFHGSWVYEVSETLAEKIRWTRTDLLEKA